VVTITGGKLTTYRLMAADTVDAVLRVLDDRGTRPIRRRCPTARLRLRGALGYERSRRATVPGLSSASVEHLADRYGGEASILFAMVERDPDLAEPLVDGLPYLRAEARYAVRYEMATGLEDVLDRRTRARLLAREATARAAGRVAELVADELGWSPDDRRAATERYRAALEADRAAADLPEIALESVIGA
jgi:glycerol-3-phosphate dehydrogenase